MIIEIKGLPDGRTVKHINVDITFDETGPVVKQTVIPHSQPAPTEPQTGNVNDNSPVIAPDTHIERPAVEIPPEMRDLEF